MEGNDHRVSLLPSEFTKMVDGIREVEIGLGDAGPRHLSQGELMNRIPREEPDRKLLSVAWRRDRGAHAGSPKSRAWNAAKPDWQCRWNGRVA